MEWKTKIAKSSNDETLIRGYDLLDLIGKINFTEAIYLVLKGELPSEKETKMLNAIFVAAIEHGINPPSTMAARIIASCGTDFNDALAAGLLAIGKNHGGAMEQGAKMLQENINNSTEEIVKQSLSQKKKLSGYGHKLYSVDKRALKLLRIAEELGFKGKYISKALEIERELEKQKGKKLCINIDGVIAAIVSELGFNWNVAQAFFIIPRIVGLSAHVHEEIDSGTSYRRLEENESQYVGENKRNLLK